MKVYFEDVDLNHPDPNVAVHTTFDVDHGRLESRFHGITADVSSLPADPQLFAVTGRSHWEIENSFHYLLDVGISGGWGTDKDGGRARELGLFPKDSDDSGESG